MTGMRPKVERRMGPAGSGTWHAMLDGAEAVLRDEGHGALTSRRIAEQIGVKQRLVYYYFATMDDLVTALFRRLSERELVRLHEAQGSNLPLRQLWEICMNTADGRLISEFMAFANRIDGLRQEVIHFVVESRRIQVAVLKSVFGRLPGTLGHQPQALAIFAASTALTINRERHLGIDFGHSEALETIGAFLDAAEPLPRPTS